MTKKILARSTDDKWLGGVCGGIARYTGVDATIVRLVVAVLTIIGFGSLIVAYVVAWLVMPPQSALTTWQQPAAPASDDVPAPPSR